MTSFLDSGVHPYSPFPILHQPAPGPYNPFLEPRSAHTQQKKRHLKPGGYLEIQEFHYHPHCDDDSLTESTPYRLTDFFVNLAAGLSTFGSDLHAILSAPALLSAAGFTPATHHVLKCPIGVWPRLPRLAYCGDLLRTVILEGLGGLARKPFVVGLGWTGMQIEMLLVEVRRAVSDKGFHTYLPFHVVYGQKPME